MAKQSVSSKQREQLLRAPRRVTKHADAPYSDFRVGAAILTSNGEIFDRCNVEYASYGMTNCAERTAIISTISPAAPKLQIRAVASVDTRRVACSHCGACRQVIYELGT